MKILMIGDIYGKTGRETLERQLPVLINRYHPDWIIANGENVTAGNGLSAKHAHGLKKCGVDVITSGNHIFARLDWLEVLKNHDYILRPHNMAAESAPGVGCRVFKKENLAPIAVVNLAGRVFMDAAECPFKVFDRLFASLPDEIVVIVDFHAEATSEKLAFFWYVNGRATIAVGTHTHVQTSDERILPNGGTAVITDLGMTGANDGIIGVDRDTVTGRFVTGFSDKFLCAPGPGKIEGMFVDTGPGHRAVAVERFRIVESALKKS
ncbi:MAG: TIGR00282 family metallophosphoesterase [Candidatus Riflebacteria bacterium]|nr:TIGR00282 family metallophosphoesterase [Candidatus Riflebacteria bacterium]